MSSIPCGGRRTAEHHDAHEPDPRHHGTRGGRVNTTARHGPLLNRTRIRLLEVVNSSFGPSVDSHSAQTRDGLRRRNPSKAFVPPPPALSTVALNTDCVDGTHSVFTGSSEEFAELCEVEEGMSRPTDPRRVPRRCERSEWVVVAL